MQRKLREIEDAVERDEIHLLRAGTAIGLVIAGAAVAGILLLGINRPAMSPSGNDAPVTDAAFTPPPLTAIPAGPEGDSIKRGMAIFDNPRANAAAFVGNAMACKNCHLDSGRRANSSPMWAAWVSYPQYRKKNNSINTMLDRIEACFRYSMNAPNSASGGPPPPDSDIYRDLEAYFHWLAKGAPTGQSLPGGGYPKPQLSAAGYDPARGAAIFAASCTACHGNDGQGASQPNGTVVYPPLWGPRSYNWGAGMARVDLAAGFIKANMPFDKPGTLSDQDAWDVAAFIDSHERPRDPRQKGSVADNAKANFAGQKSYYGTMVGGKLLGTGVSGAR
jgi:thiosulfate dehydrogenase